jgi:hypothetical protein
MPAVLEPDSCLRCQNHLQPTYAERRNAKLQGSTKLLLGVIAGATIVLLLVFLFEALGPIRDWIHQFSLRRREKGLLWFLLLAVCATSMVALVTFSTRRVLARKWVTQVACTQCGTVSTCLISEFNFEEAIDRLADNKPRPPSGRGDQESLTPDQDAPTGAIPSGDSGYVAPDQAPPVEDLRDWVRLRLAQAASAEEVADQLVQQGFDPRFATELVHSVLSVGGAREVVLGESVAFDGKAPLAPLGSRGPVRGLLGGKDPTGRFTRLLNTGRTGG